MSEQQVDVFFRGDIVAGEKVAAVRTRLRELFKADDAQMARLFSGRPVAIRRGQSPEEADRYQQALLNAGALVELRASEPGQPSGEQAPASSAQAAAMPPPAGVQENPAGLSIAPVGADVLREDERATVAPVNVDIGALDVAPQVGDLLEDHEKAQIEPVSVDVSQLRVEELPPGQSSD